MMNWDNLFFNHFQQPERQFLSAQPAATLSDARLLAWSSPCAAMLGVQQTSADWLGIMAGQHTPAGVAPCATVYSGHQFGVWAGQLGDGRALLLGGIETPSGNVELQLKGSGRTPYSRGADGKAVLRSSIREFLCSEAMAGLGIPTTRALALAASPQAVYRESAETAAVVLRAAPSFIRFGHFEHFAARGDAASVQRLADFVCEHYYPAAAAHAAGTEARYLALLAGVCERTARTVAGWQSMGFCHGVMNTDNMSILGLTIDYGPFGFLDTFDPQHICNHTDEQGRYSYMNQPSVAHWNLACLAQALSTIVPNHDALKATLDTFVSTFEAAHTALFCNKLGIESTHPKAEQLINGTLQCLYDAKADMTLFFRRLSHASDDFSDVRDVCINTSAFDEWLPMYQNMVGKESLASPQRRTTMLAANPKYVLRNHLAELAIRETRDTGSTTELLNLLKVLENPFEEQPEFERYAALPPAWASQLEVSCSS